MKRIFAMIFVLLCFSVTAFALDGEGTEESPFIVTDEEELLLVGDFPDCHFRLGNDITLSKAITPLCYYGDDFTGVLDGNGYTISNFSTTGGTTYGKKQLGLLTINKGTIKNLTVNLTEDDWSYAMYSNDDYWGTICGINSGRIENCRINGQIQAKSSNSSYSKGYLGGICGENTSNGIISFCSVDGVFDLQRISHAGAVAGVNKGTIEYVGARYTKNGSSWDGLAYSTGTNSWPSGSISNSYAIGNDSGFSSGSNRTNCYYINTYGSSPYGKVCKSSTFTQKTIAAMKMKPTYTREGFDFDTIWGINKNINGGYPYLLWEYPDEQVNHVLTETKANVLEDTLSFDINIDNNALGKVVHMALYDQNNRLLRTYKVPNIDNKKNIVVALDAVSEASYAKIFVWDSITSLVPLGDCERVAIPR